jgi:hypothetical protein
VKRRGLSCRAAAGRVHIREGRVERAAPPLGPRLPRRKRSAKLDGLS